MWTFEICICLSNYSSVISPRLWSSRLRRTRRPIFMRCMQTASSVNRMSDVSLLYLTLKLYLQNQRLVFWGFPCLLLYYQCFYTLFPAIAFSRAWVAAASAHQGVFSDLSKFSQPIEKLCENYFFSCVSDASLCKTWTVMTDISYCEKSGKTLRSSNDSRTCSGKICFFSELQARSLGFSSSVYLCTHHYFESRRNEECCFPFPGQCSQRLVDCPTRLFPVFDVLNAEKVSTKLCTLHAAEADKLDIITGHPLYQGPKTRKVSFIK